MELWTRYVALGDSVTEGWRDPVFRGELPESTEPWFGWADRLALAIDAHVRMHGGRRLEFANLAMRGRKVRGVVEEQIPEALRLAPGLVSILIGGNDLLSPRAKPDLLAARLERGVRDLRAAGIDVLLVTQFDRGGGALLRGVQQRAAAYNERLRRIAREHGCLLLDAWRLPELRYRSAWDEDLMHPSTFGHVALARAAARVLGLSAMPDDPDDDLPAANRLPAHRWVRRHLIPWLGRRIRRVSSGDGLGPKQPTPAPPMRGRAVADARVTFPRGREQSPRVAAAANGSGAHR